MRNTMNSDDMQNLIDSLKNNTEQLIFDIASDTEKQIIHKNSLGIFADLTQLQKIIESPSFKTCLDLDTTRIAMDIEQSPQHTEINKVARRLKKWATLNGKEQANSKILQAFLKLRKRGHDPITEKDLKKEYCKEEGDADKFNRNFPQMKIISPKNHGKVFEEKYGNVVVWKPIEDFVNEFDKSISEDHDK